MTYRAWFDRASSTKSQITHRGGITRALRCTLQYEIMLLVVWNLLYEIEEKAIDKIILKQRL